MYNGADLELCPRRPALRRTRAAGGGLLRFRRPERRASAKASGRVRRHPASRLLQWLRAAVRPAPEGVADHAGILLRPCAAGLLRTGRYREKGAQGRERQACLSPIALEAVLRLDALFEIERDINGRAPEERRAVRQDKSKPLFDDMQAWLIREREPLSRSAAVLKLINYMLKRWSNFARFLDDGRICLSNNAAERSLRGIALGRRNWTFAGSPRGADRAAVMLTIITTCRLNDVGPKAWLADILARIADLPRGTQNRSFRRMRTI